VLDRNAGPNRGASTINMQTVKNLFLWNSRSYVRKALRAILSIPATDHSEWCDGVRLVEVLGRVHLLEMAHQAFVAAKKEVLALLKLQRFERALAELACVRR
jgi:hypothetical protein